MQRKENTCEPLVGRQIAIAIMARIFIKVPQKNYKWNYHIIQQFHLGAKSKGNKIKFSKGYLHSHVHCAINHNSQDVKPP